MSLSVAMSRPSLGSRPKLAPLPSSAAVGVLSRSTHDSLSSLLAESSLLSKAELARMRETGKGEEGRWRATEAAAAAKQGQLIAAAARKQKMLLLEAERKLAVPPTEVEQQKAREKAALLSSSEKQMAEELDDVKKMNQMMLYSKVVTIRDGQLNEKKVVQKEKLAEERRLDTVMEVERLKALRMYEEREQRRKEEQRVGAQVIINQMKERERERVRQLELQDQEREAMLRQNEDLKNDDLRQAQMKKENGKKLLEEVAQSNADQITLKKARATPRPTPHAAISRSGEGLRRGVVCGSARRRRRRTRTAASPPTCETERCGSRSCSRRRRGSKQTRRETQRGPLPTASLLPSLPSRPLPCLTRLIHPLSLPSLLASMYPSALPPPSLALFVPLNFLPTVPAADHTPSNWCHSLTSSPRLTSRLHLIIPPHLTFLTPLRSLTHLPQPSSNFTYPHLHPPAHPSTSPHPPHAPHLMAIAHTLTSPHSLSELTPTLIRRASLFA